MPVVLNKRKDKIPRNAIYVGRGSKYGNPFRISKEMPRDRVILLYARLLQDYINSGIVDIEDIQRELGGHDLVCYCAPLPCHADVLLLAANPELMEEQNLDEAN